MAQTGYTPLALYYSTAAAAVPSASNLISGELALNIADGKLYYKDTLGNVKLLASNSAASGGVTAVSVASSNGFTGTSSGGATPVLTLATSVTGIIKGNGTALSAAVSGTDYAPATTGSAILKGNGAGGFSSAVASTDYAPATTGSAILKGNGSGGFGAAVSGTDYAPATSGTSILYGDGAGGFSNVTVGAGLAFVGGTISASGGGGDVYGPASSTDNAVARFDSTTGKILQNSSVTISDTGTLTATTLAGEYNPASLSSSVPYNKGGTGLSTYATGDLIYASSATALARRAIGTSGQVLTVSGGVPTWSTLTTGVSSVKGQASDSAQTGAVVLTSLASFGSSIGSNGYQKLPGGLIMMWGFSTISANTTTVNFASATGISFPSACYSFIATPQVPGDTGGADNTIGVSSLSATSALLSTATTQAGFYWVAFGS